MDDERAGTPINPNPHSLAPNSALSAANPTGKASLKSPNSGLSELNDFRDILSRYLAPKSIEKVARAFQVADIAHAGQNRKSGEPYITHPLAVATLLTEWHMDADGLCAALLHDVIEDTPVSKGELEAQFGKAVAELVDAVSKIDQLEHQTAQDQEAETLRKIILAMSRDVRVMFIKLADRLHNMRTLGSLSTKRKQAIARETLDIFAPVAEKLGLAELSRELKDLSFQHLYPLRYELIAKSIKSAQRKHIEMVRDIEEKISLAMKNNKLQVSISYRQKNPYSIYLKMRDRKVKLTKITDIFGFRLVVKGDTRECYVVLGVLHSLFKPQPEKFKDYIAHPKGNGYQSLHTILIAPQGGPLEIQIRTETMHRTAEYGVAAHWRYKTNESNSRQKMQQAAQEATERSLNNLYQVETLNGDSAAILEHIKTGLKMEEMYVLTPKGQFVGLPIGATVLDFAYAVHSQVGDRCQSALVNQQKASLHRVLHNGDLVEVITNSSAHPAPTWLNFVTTARARTHIRAYLKSMQGKESQALGERLLLQAVTTLAGDWSQIPIDRWQEVAKAHKLLSKKALIQQVGSGQLLAFHIARELLNIESTGSGGSTHIRINHCAMPAIRYGKCCHAIPGDDIIGLFRKSVGLEIHREICEQPRKLLLDAVEYVPVAWDELVAGTFTTTVKVVNIDEKGALAQLARVIADADVYIERLDIQLLSDGRGLLVFDLQVRSTWHLDTVLQRIRQERGVQKAERA